MPSRHRARRELRDAQLRSLLARFGPLKPGGAKACCVLPVDDQGQSEPAEAEAEDFWARVPAGLDPSDGELDEGRSARKRQQLGSMVAYVLPLLQAGDVIADFGAGSGHLGLLLAWLRPDCHVVLVERKEYSAIYGRRRIAAMQLSNCEFFCGGIEEFADLPLVADQPSELRLSSEPATRTRYGGRVDVGVAMHACGLLTDLAIDLCVQRDGQVGASSARPRSVFFQEHFTLDEFRNLASGADFTVRAGNWDFAATQSFNLAKQCMTAVDCDRLESVAEALHSQQSKRLRLQRPKEREKYEHANEQHEQQQSWTVMLGTLRPWNCSPKNNVILCGPQELLLPHDEINNSSNGGHHGASGFLSQMASLVSALPANAKSTRTPPVFKPKKSRGESRELEAMEIVATEDIDIKAAAAASVEWYPSLGQRVWVEPDCVNSGKVDTSLKIAFEYQVQRWAGVIVASRGVEWQVSPELACDSHVAGEMDGVDSSWWAQFQLASRWRDRDAQDTAEALGKSLGGLRIESTLPWQNKEESQYSCHQQRAAEEKHGSTRLSEWVHWVRLRPRGEKESFVDPAEGAIHGAKKAEWCVIEPLTEGRANTGKNDYDRWNEAEALMRAGILPTDAQIDIESGDYSTTVDGAVVGTVGATNLTPNLFEHGELGLAVESGGPLGQMRYASGAAFALQSTTGHQTENPVTTREEERSKKEAGSRGALLKRDDHEDKVTSVKALGHGQPGKRWVGLAGLAGGCSQQGALPMLAPVFDALLALLQQPPVLPTLRRNLDTLSFYFCRSGGNNWSQGWKSSRKCTGQLVLVFGFRDRGRGRAHCSSAAASPLQNSTTLRAILALEERLSVVANRSRDGDGGCSTKQKICIKVGVRRSRFAGGGINDEAIMFVRPR